MPRNKSEQSLRTEARLNEKVQTYAKAVEWLSAELREYAAMALRTNDVMPSHEPCDLIFTTSLRDDPQNINVPPVVMEALDMAPYDS